MMEVGLTRWVGALRANTEVSWRRRDSASRSRRPSGPPGMLPTPPYSSFLILGGTWIQGRFTQHLGVTDRDGHSWSLMLCPGRSWERPVPPGLGLSLRPCGPVMIPKGPSGPLAVISYALCSQWPNLRLPLVLLSSKSLLCPSLGVQTSHLFLPNHTGRAGLCKAALEPVCTDNFHGHCSRSFSAKHPLSRARRIQGQG